MVASMFVVNEKTPFLSLMHRLLHPLLLRQPSESIFDSHVLFLIINVASGLLDAFSASLVFASKESGPQ